MPIQVFGQGAVQTAYIGLINYNLTANLVLVWPNSFQNSPNVSPMFINVGSVSTVGLTIKIPDATQVSVGQNFIIRNGGAHDFVLLDNQGGDLGTIATGISYYYILSDNTTSAGVWIRQTYGAGISQADAVALAGKGLIADSGKLDTNVPVVSTVGPSYSVTAANNAGLIVWEGGAGNINLPAIATVVSGFYVSINNAGSGLATVQGNANINGQVDLIIGPNQSATVISDGTDWWTLGFNEQTFPTVGVRNITVAGNTNVTLSNADASFPILQFQGALTGNITVFFPSIQQQWTVFNETTGAFTLHVQLIGPTGASLIIGQGTTQIYYNDGTTLRVVPTYQASTTTFPDGAAVAPSITFTTDTNTGIYHPALDQVGITAGGAQSLNISNTSTTSYNPILSIQGTVTNPSFAFSADISSGLYQSSVGNVDITAAGTQGIRVSSTAVSMNHQVLNINGTQLLPSMSFTADNTSGVYLASVGTVGLSAGGTLGLSATNSAITSFHTLKNISGTAGAPSITFTADPTSGVFQSAVNHLSFSAQGTQVVDMTNTSTSFLNVCKHTSGTAVVPSITFTADPTSGLFQSAPGHLNLSAGGVNSIDITSTTVSILTSLTLATPLPIASGGTNANTAANAILNLMPSATTGGTVYNNGTNWVTLAAGANRKALVMNGTVPGWNAYSLLQSLSVLNTTSSTSALTTAFTLVDALTISLTTTYATSKVDIEATFTGSVATNNAVVALYRDTTQLAVFAPLYSANNNQAFSSSIRFTETPGTGTFVYSLKAATLAGTGTLQINRDQAGNITGLSSSIVINEYGGF